MMDTIISLTMYGVPAVGMILGLGMIGKAETQKIRRIGFQAIFLSAALLAINVVTR
jgi:hypothetical protein